MAAAGDRAWRLFCDHGELLRHGMRREALMKPPQARTPEDEWRLACGQGMDKPADTWTHEDRVRQLFEEALERPEESACAAGAGNGQGVGH